MGNNKEIIKIFAKFNGNPKTLKNREELIEEYKTYKYLNSLTVKLKYKDYELTLSLLSATWFILTGKVQSDLIHLVGKKKLSTV